MPMRSASVHGERHQRNQTRGSPAESEGREEAEEAQGEPLLGRHGGAAVPEHERRVPAPDHLVAVHAAPPLHAIRAEPQVPQPPRRHVEYAPVDLHAPLLDTLPHGVVGHDDADAALDAHLRHAHGARVVVADGRQLLGVLGGQGLERRQPRVEHAADAGARDGGGRGGAGGVGAEDDVLDLEVGDGELERGGRVDVGGRDDVGEVAVGEDVAGLAPEDGGFGDARVGAADPDLSC